MNKLATLTIVLIGLLTISCKKENDNGPVADSPTNDKTTAQFNLNLTYGSVTDQDGDVYKTVTIGNQTWMAENLRTTKYNDGQVIPFTTGKEAWMELTSGAYCNVNNQNDPETIATYGRLYNRYAVISGKLAPSGWHVATADDWDVLINYEGGYNVAGSKLKESGSLHWDSPNTGAINVSGFTLLPGGSRNYYLGNVENFGYQGTWWTSTMQEVNYDEEEHGVIFFFRASENKAWVSTSYGSTDAYSVRCVKN